MSIKKSLITTLPLIGLLFVAACDKQDDVKEDAFKSRIMQCSQPYESAVRAELMLKYSNMQGGNGFSGYKAFSKEVFEKHFLDKDVAKANFKAFSNCLETGVYL